MLVIDKNEFLKEQLELLKRKQTDPSIEWQDIADFRAEYYGESEHRDTVRKGSKILIDYINEGWVDEPRETIPSTENNEIVKLKKERQKLSDARVEYNRLIREEARKESFLDIVGNVIRENVSPMCIDLSEEDNVIYNEKNSLLCHFTDIHTGIEIDNNFNQFNEEILKRRAMDYIKNVLKIQLTHGSGNCYFVIGEIVSGIIHNNLRLQNNMDLIEQFKCISEIISDMLAILSKHFHNVHVYITPGNHSRITPKKEDSLTGENLDILLPFYLKARLQNIHRIQIHDNHLDSEIAAFDVYGKRIFASHGHKDSPAKVVQNFTMMFGVKPDIILLGHRHTNGLTTVFDTKVIQSGCVSGSDDYTISLRKINKPEQTISVIDNTGLVCLYDIQLD